MRMLEVQSPEDIVMQDVLNFFNHLDENFFVEAPETFFYVNKYILIYTYATNTCMLKTQVTIYHFTGNIGDKKNL